MPDYTIETQATMVDMNETKFGESKKAGAVNIKILSMGQASKFISPAKQIIARNVKINIKNLGETVDPSVEGKPYSEQHPSQDQVGIDK
jgi:hypothetical protein